MRTLFALVFLATLGVIPAVGQTSILTFGIGRMPGTDVYVENDTSDAPLMQLVVNNTTVRGFLRRASNPWHHFYGPGYGDLFLIARACGAVSVESLEVPDPPEWVIDPRIVGEQSLETIDLSGPASAWMGPLQKRVERFKGILDKQQWLDRGNKKEMKKELDEWLISVKLTLVERRVTVCQNAEDIKIRVRITTDTANRLAVPIRVTGSRGRYTVEGPVDHSY